MIKINKDVYIHTNDGFIKLNGVIDTNIHWENNDLILLVTTNLNTQAELILFGCFNKYGLERYHDLALVGKDREQVFESKVFKVRENSFKTIFEIELLQTNLDFYV